MAEVSRDNASFENVMLPMARDENSMSLETHIIGFYQAVSPDKSLRDASTEADKLLDDFGIESSLREDVFGLVDAVLKKGDKLEPESQRLLEKDHKSYVRNGLGVPAGPGRDRFKEIKKRLSDITITFQKNLNEEKGFLWFTPEELRGVPDDVVANLEKGTGENEGKVKLTFKYPDLFPALKYATNADTRRQVFLANENKCNENVPLFKEALVLRDEAARILGYKNHAEFRIEDKMAKTPKTVDDFLGDLRHRLTPGGLEEIKKLKELKKEYIEKHGSGQSYDGRYYLWDHRFYDRLMLEKQYSLDQQKIAEYFPLGPTIRGMLKIFEELFGLEFFELTAEDRDKVAATGKGADIVWHEDVQVFSVWDDEGEGGGFVGYLYLDLAPRAMKYSHAANFNLQPGFEKEDGKRRYPATGEAFPIFLHASCALTGTSLTGIVHPCSAGVQLLEADAEEAEPAQARRGRHALPRAGPRHPRPGRPHDVRALPRDQHRARLRRGPEPDAGELVLDAVAAQEPEPALLVPVVRVSGGVPAVALGRQRQRLAAAGAHPRRAGGQPDQHQARQRRAGEPATAAFWHLRHDGPRAGHARCDRGAACVRDV